MVAILSKHLITYNGAGSLVYDFFFLAPPDHYTGIEADCGVEKLTDASELQDMPVTNTDELALSPVCARKTLRVEMPGAIKKNKYVDILISTSKLVTAEAALTGKTYKGGVIKRVMDSRKRSRF